LDRHDGISADHEWRVWHLMPTTSIQLEAVGPHPQCVFTDTQRNAALQPGGVSGLAETVDLHFVSVKMWTLIMALNQLQ
jgi:hypothetical protein